MLFGAYLVVFYDFLCPCPCSSVGKLCSQMQKKVETDMRFLQM